MLSRAIPGHSALGLSKKPESVGGSLLGFRTALRETLTILLTAIEERGHESATTTVL